MNTGPASASLSRARAALTVSVLGYSYPLMGKLTKRMPGVQRFRAQGPRCYRREIDDGAHSHACRQHVVGLSLGLTTAVDVVGDLCRRGIVAWQKE